MPLKPSSQIQLKFPVGWLTQRPRGPHTLDEMCRTKEESLDATATVQLSITVPRQITKSISIRLSYYGIFAEVRKRTLTGGGLAVVLHSGAGLALVAFGTGTVEVLSHTVARGFVLTGAGVTRVCRRPCWDLCGERFKTLNKC